MKKSDVEELNNLVSIRIFGVPERIGWIERTQRLLNIPCENIFIDFEYDGCKENAKRAWLKETDKPFTMVLHDDVELCDSFVYCCKAILVTHPDDIISLFPIQFSKASDVNFVIGGAPYVYTSKLSGCGIIMQTRYVAPCVKSWSDQIDGDDVNIQRWADQSDVRIVTTLPSTIQQIEDKSFFGSTRKINKTDFYLKNPLCANWYDDYTTSWTNIVKRK